MIFHLSNLYILFWNRIFQKSQGNSRTPTKTPPSRCPAAGPAVRPTMRIWRVWKARRVPKISALTDFSLEKAGGFFGDFRQFFFADGRGYPFFQWGLTKTAIEGMNMVGQKKCCKSTKHMQDSRDDEHEVELYGFKHWTMAVCQWGLPSLFLLFGVWFLSEEGKQYSNIVYYVGIHILDTSIIFYTLYIYIYIYIIYIYI